MNAKHKQYVEGLLKDVHGQFIAAVKRGRGNALKADNKDLFSGLFWAGERARKLGLIDEMGSAGFVARDVIQAEDIVDYTLQENLFDRFAGQIGATMAHTFGKELGVSGSLPR